MGDCAERLQELGWLHVLCVGRVEPGKGTH